MIGPKAFHAISTTMRMLGTSIQNGASAVAQRLRTSREPDPARTLASRSIEVPLAKGPPSPLLTPELFADATSQASSSQDVTFHRPQDSKASADSAAVLLQNAIDHVASGLAPNYLTSQNFLRSNDPPLKAFQEHLAARIGPGVAVLAGDICQRVPEGASEDAIKDAIAQALDASDPNGLDKEAMKMVMELSAAAAARASDVADPAARVMFDRVGLRMLCPAIVRTGRPTAVQVSNAVKHALMNGNASAEAAGLHGDAASPAARAAIAGNAFVNRLISYAQS